MEQNMPNGRYDNRPPSGILKRRHIENQDENDLNNAGDTETQRLCSTSNDDDENEPLPLYDQFRTIPREDETRITSTTSKFFVKLFKYISVILCCAIVLVGGVISKACVLILGNGAKVYEGTENALDHDVIRVWSYIILLCMLLTPEVFTMGYSLYRIIMKKENPMELKTVLLGGLLELLSAFGEGILFIKVLPYLDATFACLAFPLISFAPICVNIQEKWTSYSHNKEVTSKCRKIRNLCFAIIAFILQAGGLVSCFSGLFTPVNANGKNETNTNFMQFLNINYTYVWTFVGLILASLRYWENFVKRDFHFPFGLTIRARGLQEKLDGSRFKTSFIFAFVKSSFLVGFTFLVIVVLEKETYASSYVNVGNGDGRNIYHRILYLLELGSERSRYSRIITALVYVFATQAGCALAVFFFGRVACLTLIQRLAYASPVITVTPVISALTAALTTFKEQHPDNGLINFVGLGREYGYLERYVDWNTVISLDHGNMVAFVIVGLILGWLGKILVTTFIWSPQQIKLERTEVLFVKAQYGGPLIDQALMLNRRQFEKEYSESLRARAAISEMKQIGAEPLSRNHRLSRRYTLPKNYKFTPMLFLCATMWHETKQEMTQILTSIMRLDKDHHRRKDAKDSDSFNFEVHVMFDDAMERGKGKDEQPKANSYVKQLCELIPVAAEKVELEEEVGTPIIYSTPYGGKLVFTLPHGNKMIVHLKDKEKIRHRKRWSQCMYMYYILGYLQSEKKKYDLDNIFILALDGDVDFQPKAVHLLLDRMKKNPDVGAACGRIHPTGSGPVVWFQKFEYAVGHWLQKTAEHVLGCVLCSPGCFSMFRGSALVEDNVMHTYTSMATEAHHHLQWDQGEDRWLCTLLLKQGWRIEYSAASDSYTFAPEEFKEFYNQRRRWGPSTMANILDILNDSKLTVRNNTYISWGYIVYQVGLMASSIIAPATVILVVAESYKSVFDWDATASLLVALIPVVIFVILCYTTKPDFQILVAAILTIIYALVMLAVMVILIAGIASGGLLEPNNIFVITLVGLYFFTGIVHPHELLCLAHGLLYYLCVPSAFIFLMVYSLTNMNNVSWGTRESKKPEETQETQAQNESLEGETGSAKPIEVKSQNLSIQHSHPDNEGSYSCGLCNICSCSIGVRPTAHAYKPLPKSEPKKEKGIKRRPTIRRNTKPQASKPNQGNEKRVSVKQMKKWISQVGTAGNLTTAKVRALSRRQKNKKLSPAVATSVQEKALQLGDELTEDQAHCSSQEVHLEMTDTESEVDSIRLKEESTEGLRWVMDGTFEDAHFDFHLPPDERKFWKYLIEQYLEPLDMSKEEKEKVSADLKELRNKMSGAYFFANALWIVLNFALQKSVELHLSFEFQGKTVEANVVAVLFLVFFLIILIIQFICMLVHRWSTALHVLASTPLKWADGREDIKSHTVGQKEERRRQNQSFERTPTSTCNSPAQSEISRGAAHYNQAYEPDGEYDDVIENKPRDLEANYSQVGEEIYSSVQESVETEPKRLLESTTQAATVTNGVGKRNMPPTPPPIPEKPHEMKVRFPSYTKAKPANGTARM